MTKGRSFYFRCLSLVGAGFLFLSPLIVSGGIDSFGLGKRLFLKAFILVASLFFFLEDPTNSRLKLPRWLIGLGGVFLLSSIFSTINSTNASLSFWGYFFQYGGFLEDLSLVLLGVVLIAFFQKIPQDYVRPWLWGAFGVFVVALFQFLPFVQESQSANFLGRSFGTIGSPPLLGAFFILPFFLSAPRSKPLALCFLIGILLSGTRSALLGVMLGVSLIFAFNFWAQKSRLLSAFLVTTILCLGITFYFGVGFRSFTSRVELWKASSSLALNAPFWGYGLESFSDLIWTQDLSSLYLYEDISTTPSHPHNELLEVLIERGYFGLLAFLSGILFLAWKLFKTQELEKQWMLAGLLALFTNNLFSFSVEAHAIQIVFVLALCAQKDVGWSLSERSQKLLFGVLVFLSAFIFLDASKLSSVNRQLTRGPEEWLSAFERASIHPDLANWVIRQEISLYRLESIPGLDLVLEHQLAIQSRVSKNDHNALLNFYDFYGEESFYDDYLSHYAVHPFLELVAFDKALAREDTALAEVHFRRLLHFLRWEERGAESKRILFKNNPYLNRVFDQAQALFGGSLPTL